MPNNEDLTKSLRSLQSKGQQLYEEYSKTRLEDCSVSIPATIPQNKILLPSNNAQVESEAKFKFVTPTVEKKDFPDYEIYSY